VVANSRKAGSAATGAELKNLQKYQDISTGVDFIPVAIETSSVWVQHAMELVSEIGDFRSKPRTTVKIVLVSAACSGCSTRQCLLHYWDIAGQQFNQQAVA